MFTKLKMASWLLVLLNLISGCAIPVTATCPPDSSLSAPSVLTGSTATTQTDLIARYEQALQELRSSQSQLLESLKKARR